MLRQTVFLVLFAIAFISASTHVCAGGSLTQHCQQEHPQPIKTLVEQLSCAYDASADLHPSNANGERPLISLMINLADYSELYEDAYDAITASLDKPISEIAENVLEIYGDVGIQRRAMRGGINHVQLLKSRDVLYAHAIYQRENGNKVEAMQSSVSAMVIAYCYALSAPWSDSRSVISMDSGIAENLQRAWHIMRFWASCAEDKEVSSTILERHRTYIAMCSAGIRFGTAEYYRVIKMGVEHIGTDESETELEYLLRASGLAGLNLDSNLSRKRVTEIITQLIHLLVGAADVDEVSYRSLFRSVEMKVEALDDRGAAWQLAGHIAQIRHFNRQIKHIILMDTNQ